MATKLSVEQIGSVRIAIRHITRDADFDEGKHKRDAGGKFAKMAEAANHIGLDKLTGVKNDGDSLSHSHAESWMKHDALLKGAGYIPYKLEQHPSSPGLHITTQSYYNPEKKTSASILYTDEYKSGGKGKQSSLVVSPADAPPADYVKKVEADQAKAKAEKEKEKAKEAALEEAKKQAGPKADIHPDDIAQLEHEHVGHSVPPEPHPGSPATAAVADHLRPDAAGYKDKALGKYVSKRLELFDAALKQADPVAALNAVSVSQWHPRLHAYRAALIKGLNESKPAPEALPAGKTVKRTKIKTKGGQHIIIDHHIDLSVVPSTPPKDDAELDKLAVAYIGNLPPSQYEAIKSYQGSGFGSMNRYLAGTDAVVSPHVVEKTKHMQAAMQNAYLPKDFSLTRGIKASLKSLTGFDDPAKAIGGIFEHKAFASASRMASKAESFSGGAVVMKFTVPKGTRALMMHSQSSSAPYYEQEIVMPPASMFKIKDVTHDGSKHVLHCEYLGEKVHHA